MSCSSLFTSDLNIYEVHATSRPPEPYKSLFTPTPSPSAPAQSRRVFASHVAVPSLPPGRNISDYQRILKNEDRSRPSLKHRDQKTVLEGRNPAQGTSIPPKIKGKAARVEIARIPKDDVDVLSFHLRFLRQIVEVPEHGWSLVPFVGICEPCEPCWRGWTSPVCQSLSDTSEEKLSLGGCVEFSEEDDSEVGIELEVTPAQEEETQQQQEPAAVMHGAVHADSQIYSALSPPPIMDPWVGHFPPLDTAPFGDGTIDPSLIYSLLLPPPMVDPWTAHFPPLDTAPFGDGTIDPSLISGSGLAVDVPFEPLPDSPSLSPLSPESSPEPPPKKSPASRKGAAFLSPPSALSSPSARVHTLRPYLKPSRIPNDMVSSADLQLTSSEDETSSDALLVRKMSRKKKQKPVPTSDQATTKSQSIKPIKSTRDVNWPRIPEPDYCHQCRSKSNILKIFCTCNRKFCVRCLSTRYNGEVLYEPNSATPFVCPVCKNICTCDKCTPLRGEVYVPLRGPKAVGASTMRWSLSEDKSAASETSEAKPGRKRLGGKTNLPPPITRVSSEQTYTGPIAYLGAVYDLMGTKVGSAFKGTEPGSALAGTNGERVERVVMIRTLQEGFVQPEESKEKEERKRKKPKPRVYVGQLEPTWGFGDDVAMRYLEPISWKDRNNGPHERTYVGNKAMLRKPFITDLDNLEGPWRRPPEVEEYDEFPSPLTSLEDSDDVAGAGESRQWPFRHTSDPGVAVQEDLEVLVKKGPGKGFCANSLREVDVTRAITMGLMACGVGVKLL